MEVAGPAAPTDPPIGLTSQSQEQQCGAQGPPSMWGGCKAYALFQSTGTSTRHEEGRTSLGVSAAEWAQLRRQGAGRLDNQSQGVLRVESET